MWTTEKERTKYDTCIITRRGFITFIRNQLSINLQFLVRSLDRVEVPNILSSRSDWACVVSADNNDKFVFIPLSSLRQA